VLAILGTDAPWAVELFLVVQVATLPLMGVAIACAAKGRIRAHAALMIVTYGAFLLSLIAFEWTVRTMDDKPALPGLVLFVHLLFAVPGLILWSVQLFRGTRAPSEPARHRRRGRMVFGLLVATVATGVWVFVEMFG
jgi:uncharacterized membrane protein YozB (DUF420 family)